MDKSQVTYRNKAIQSRSFPYEKLNIATFNKVVDGIDKRLVNWSHDVSEENRRVRLDEDEGSQTPNASDESKR